MRIQCKRYGLALVLVVLSSLYALSVGASPTVESCVLRDWKQSSNTGGVGVQALLEAIQAGTKWADLPTSTKKELRVLADNRLAVFRAHWAKDALVQKEAILLGCPTSHMTAAMDDYYRKSYKDFLPSTFSLADLKNVDLRRALVRSYLGAIAGYRASNEYFSHDWDGESLFDSVRLPDRQTYEDIKHYNASVVNDLKSLQDLSLSEIERSLKRERLFTGRALSVGAFSTDSFGGADMETACRIIKLHNDVVDGYEADKGRPKMFASDEDVLREVNAIFLNNIDLKWLDVGTLAAAIKETLCRGTDEDLEKYVAPQSNEVAKGIVLLRNWWIERVSAPPSAQNKCSIYSVADRDQLWEAFSADQHFNNDRASSMETLRGQLVRLQIIMVERYRDIARNSLEQVFPDSSVLTQEQRSQVRTTIDNDTAFGLFPSKIARALDLAQNTTEGPAARMWKRAIEANVTMLGGNYSKGDSVRSQDEAAIRAMFEEVKLWVAARYKDFPIDISNLYDKFKFQVTTGSNAVTSIGSGDIKFGIGTKRSKMEYYSILLHELRHAVNYARFAVTTDKSKVTPDTGPAVEGSGIAVESLLIDLFMRELLKNDLAYWLYALHYGIRDIRLPATTDATLQKFFRRSCADTKEPNTLDFTKLIMESYGLPGDIADTQALRAHIGTQYLQYISASSRILDDIDYLQNAIDPKRSQLVDPFVLFACGLNNPRRDEGYIAEIKTCMKR